MKTIFWITSILCFCSCSNSKLSLQEKFDNFRNENFSKFNDISIIRRYNRYVVYFQDQVYTIDMNHFTQKISSITKIERDETKISLSEIDITYIENAINKFDSLGFLSISVDEFRNVFVSFLWERKCTYYFLKLSSSNTLRDIKREYYKEYEDKWYFDKRCSE